MANHVLLLGAGFSRNWGGWLGPEVHEYLLGSPEVTDELRDLLWANSSTGFESALAHLQEPLLRDPNAKPTQQLLRLQGAIHRMFEEMDRGYADLEFEF